MRKFNTGETILMKQYFKSRKGWAIHTEKLITKTMKDQQEYWSRIMEQRIKQAKDKVYIEKQSEIRELQDEIDNKKNQIAELRKQNLEVEKYKNDLAAKIQSLDYQRKIFEEFVSQANIRIGMMDHAVKTSEKLLRKQ